jgi:putative PIN family toxin of toxin-antitoxin system
MRVILDTNVILSAIFFGGVPGRILTAYRDGKLTIVLSPEILDEYRTTAVRLAKKFDVEYEEILDWIAVHSEMMAVPSLDQPGSADPDDDKFIACSLASGAKVICSGDKHLLDVNGYRGIEVLRPRAFVDQYL